MKRIDHINKMKKVITIINDASKLINEIEVEQDRLKHSSCRYVVDQLHLFKVSSFLILVNINNYNIGRQITGVYND